MKNAIDPIKKSRQIGVENGRFDELETGLLGQRRYLLLLALALVVVEEAVDADDLVAAAQQLFTQMRADKARCAGLQVVDTN